MTAMWWRRARVDGLQILPRWVRARGGGLSRFVIQCFAVDDICEGHPDYERVSLVAKIM